MPCPVVPASIRAWSSEGGSVSVQARHHRVMVMAGVSQERMVRLSAWAGGFCGQRSGSAWRGPVRIPRAGTAPREPKDVAAPRWSMPAVRQPTSSCAVARSGDRPACRRPGQCVPGLWRRDRGGGISGPVRSTLPGSSSSISVGPGGACEGRTPRSPHARRSWGNECCGYISPTPTTRPSGCVRAQMPCGRSC